MAILLACKVGHQLRAVALDFPVEEGEACVGDNRQQEEVEKYQEEFLLCYANWGGSILDGFGPEEAMLLWE